MNIIGTDISHAKNLLEKGGLVSIPTETVYGLAANAFDEDAILKIFKAKNRPSFDPLIVHAASIKQIESFVIDIPKLFYDLAESFWPGPLTILLPKKNIISDLVTSGLPQVAVRIPNHPIALELLQSLAFPLAAPSANPFGYVSPTTAKHVEDQLGNKISYILDGGPCKIGLESTIISIDSDEVCIHRLGGVSIEYLESKIGKYLKFADPNNRVQVPGTMKSHYSPRKKIILGEIDELLESYIDKDAISLPSDSCIRGKIGILSFNKKYDYVDSKNQVALSDVGNLDEAARNLFSGLRYLDSLDIELIISEYVPNVGIGLAVNDRLRRAAAPAVAE